MSSSHTSCSEDDTVNQPDTHSGKENEANDVDYENQPRYSNPIGDKTRMKALAAICIAGDVHCSGRRSRRRVL